jgi:acetyl-CoA carboxylase alpha subunit
MGRLRVPVVACILGEGGSGGALGIGVANRVLMMEIRLVFGHLAGGLRGHLVEQP